MDKPKTQPKYSPEVRERAIRMVFEHAGRTAECQLASPLAGNSASEQEAGQISPAGRQAG